MKYGRKIVWGIFGIYIFTSVHTPVGPVPSENYVLECLSEKNPGVMETEIN